MDASLLWNSEQFIIKALYWLWCYFRWSQHGRPGPPPPPAPRILRLHGLWLPAPNLLQTTTRWTRVPWGWVFQHSLAPPLTSLPSLDYDNQLAAEFLSRKSSASSTASLDRHSSRTKVSTTEDKLSGVRAKIALFSSETQRSSESGKEVLGKYQSSEDVGKMALGSPLTRAHTHSDVRFDETGAKRQASSHHLLKTEARKVKDNSNLKPHNKSTSFRSMINVSSSQVIITLDLYCQFSINFNLFVRVPQHFPATRKCCLELTWPSPLTSSFAPTRRTRSSGRSR